MPARIWSPQIEYFSKNYRAVAFDPRSQGDSEVAQNGHTPDRRARDIKELLDQFKEASFVLVGWSLGSDEALTYIKLFGDENLSGVV
ncbi:MAG: alpha/beta hydrolase, partial [Deltaproteobacteria bacterium]|nr:alpha/beta hydrolase [Deltaproteobacteria bacterium]